MNPVPLSRRVEYEVVAAARSAYGPSDDFRGIRDAWDAVFPDGVYSASAFARAKGLA